MYIRLSEVKKGKTLRFVSTEPSFAAYGGKQGRTVEVSDISGNGETFKLSMKRTIIIAGAEEYGKTWFLFNIKE